MHLTAKLLLSAAALAALSTGAMAADLAMPMKAAPMMAAAPSSNWDGLYIGANAGYAWGTVTSTPPSPGVVATANSTGWAVGGQIGYNFHVADSIVLGVQGDLDWTNNTASLPTASYTEGLTGAVVGRLGVDMGQWLPYIEAGVAFESATVDPTAVGQPNITNSQTGWVVGAGVQVMLADNISADVEYRYASYGATTYATSTPASINNTDSQVRVGLNYHF
jgi:outer membrane immunogenic protein